MSGHFGGISESRRGSQIPLQTPGSASAPKVIFYLSFINHFSPLASDITRTWSIKLVCCQLALPAEVKSVLAFWINSFLFFVDLTGVILAPFSLAVTSAVATLAWSPWRSAHWTTWPAGARVWRRSGKNWWKYSCRWPRMSAQSRSKFCNCHISKAPCSLWYWFNEKKTSVTNKRTIKVCSWYFWCHWTSSPFMCLCNSVNNTQGKDEGLEGRAMSAQKST